MTVPTPCLSVCTDSSPRRVTPARPSAVPGSGTPHGDTLKPLRRTCGREAARPEIRPERQNCVQGYTRWEIWGIWSMAADEIRWGIEYQGENQKNNGLAGRRLTDSGVSMTRTPGANEASGHFSVAVVIGNQGRAVAKFVTAICQIVQGSFKVFGSAAWQKTDGDTSCQFQTRVDNVIYPDIPTAVGKIEFSPVEPRQATPVMLRVSVYAEGMTGRTFNFTVDPNAA